MHVLRGRMTVGELTVVIAYLGAVYGPLSSIAHTTGQLQGAIAGARRVRAMLRAGCRRPSTRPTPSTRRRCTGEIRFEDVGFSLSGRHARFCTTSASRRSPAR